MEKIKKNSVIINPDYPSSRICDVRAPREGDAAALAAGRVFARTLPLTGEWIKVDAYEWGDQRAICFARWNRHTGAIQVLKAHGAEEDLSLDDLGNLWEFRWNSAADKWDRRLVG